MRLVRRTLGVALWRLGFQSRDMGPVRPARITILAAHAVYDQLDADIEEGRR